VSDLDRSIAWFRDMLGFEVVFRAEQAGWAEVASPTSGVTIGLGQNEQVDGRGGTTPVFGVEDIAAARAELERKGVRFDGDTIEIPGMVTLATFFDPDGNTYMFAQTPGG
jgi:catechol 2,3-dioxygenase-like lactoylglutathione lyase family enzyme